MSGEVKESEIRLKLRKKNRTGAGNMVTMTKLDDAEGRTVGMKTIC